MNKYELIESNISKYAYDMIEKDELTPQKTKIINLLARVVTGGIKDYRSRNPVTHQLGVDYFSSSKFEEHCGLLNINPGIIEMLLEMPDFESIEDYDLDDEEFI